jgi:hypothetical protein
MSNLAIRIILVLKKKNPLGALPGGRKGIPGLLGRTSLPRPLLSFPLVEGYGI